MNDELTKNLAAKFPAPAYAANVLVDLFEDAKRLFLDYMIDVDCAHAVMLAEQGIITQQDASVLLHALQSLDRDAIRVAAYDGSCEDLFFYLERLMCESCDEEVAGKLHTARSRNDTDTTIYRMRLRVDALAVMRATMDLRRVFLDTAARHHDTIIPAYTHTQPAQPTTLAHYLLAMAEVAGRDVCRLARSFDLLNLSPLGACAITTTGFPINRHRTADLLGFSAPAVNSYASIAATDYVTELAGAICVLATNVGKFSQDFLLWATIEYDFIHASDAFVQTSSIMPQKRNPVAFEHVRALASKSLGEATGVFTMVHNTPFGDVNDVGDDLQPLIAAALRDARRATSLFAAALSSAEFNVAKLGQRAGEGFTAVTELADTLVRLERMPFRTAHSIVARSVRQSLETNSPLTINMLQANTREVTGETLAAMSSEDLREALDARNFVRVRNIFGGPAPSETRRALEVEISKAHDDEVSYAAKVTLLAAYKARLDSLIVEYNSIS